MPTSQYGWFNQLCLYQCFNSQDDLGDHLSEEGVYRFVFFVWHHAVRDVLKWLVEAKQRRPQDLFYFLCSEEGMARDLRVLGVQAWHVSHNAFLDEELYTIGEPEREKCYDAVYIARMNRFKRHELARDIPKALFIGSVITQGDDVAWYEELATMMPEAHFTHREGLRWLSTPQVAQRATEASVGLILSAVEGGSYATTEYLLCGLPVVSTASEGGRDSWLDARYSRVVPATPQAVAEAVAELKAAELSPWDIRDFAIGQICQQRRRLFEIGQEIYEAENCGRDFARDFYRHFRHKSADWLPHDQVLRYRPVEASVAPICVVEAEAESGDGLG